MASSSDSEESSTEPVSLEQVVEEMTEAIATLRDTTGDVSAVTDNTDILEAKFHQPNITYGTKSQSLYLGNHLADIGAAQVFTSNIAWLRGMEHGGFAEDVWPYLESLYTCCEVYAAGSESFAEELGEAGIIPILVKDLKKFKDTYTTDENQEKVVGRSLPIILTLAYTVDEENLGIMADSSVLSFIIEFFTEAVDNDAKRHLGFSASELAMGIEALSVNDTPDDNNKLTLVAEGVLPPLIKLMTEGDEEEQLHAIRAISQLAFHPDNREKIRPVIPQLQELKSSGNQAIAEEASWALCIWQLQDVESRQQKDDSDTDDSRQDSSVRHVMLSYQWDNQEVVKKVKTALEAKKYKVWMDIDQMGGSTLEAMAGAVEGAAVVLICMSRKYKESANCRGECEYARERGTDIIPLKMEDSYRPDGWLGFLVGARLYFNFDCRDRFEDVMARLIREIGDRGKHQAPDVTKVDAVEVAASTHTSQGQSLHTWAREEIRIWAQENELEGDLEKLKPEDLRFLQRMKKEAPAEFYRSIEDELGLKSISSKRMFCDALEKLEKTEQLQTFRRDKSVVKGSSTCQII